MELFNFVFDQTDLQKPLCMTVYFCWGGDRKGTSNAWIYNTILAERLSLLKSFSLRFSSNIVRWPWESLYSRHAGFLCAPCTEFAFVLFSWRYLNLSFLSLVIYKISRSYVFMYRLSLTFLFILKACFLEGENVWNLDMNYDLCFYFDIWPKTNFIT